MIKKLIGIVVAVAILVVIVLTVLGHAKYKSMMAQTETTESVAQ